ncbi:phosphoribosylformylglycinamidine synthase subunit PurS [bacterium]|nr:phosphoribosylformylglycinamidine synthase subunit PurS [bacterium]
MSYKTKVKIMLKPEVLDPQGQAIKKSLLRSGYEQINDVRVGKSIELVFDEKPSDEELKKLSETILSNPVIEVCSYES